MELKICEQNNKCRIQLQNKVPNTYSTSWSNNNPGQIKIKCKSWYLLPNSSRLTSSSIPKVTHTYLGTEKVREIYSFLCSQWEKNLRPRFIKSEIKGPKKLNFFFMPYILLFIFLFFLILFFNFTILYWFCHISKWIRHRYTCVPHPEPSSLLPPHTIPLGRPIAPQWSITQPLKRIHLNQF